MLSHFCLSVTFHAAVYHGRRDGNVPEWPPSPLRAFQALVAAAAAQWRKSDFDTYAVPALEWLEGLDPPEIVAPVGRTASIPYRLYVPNNAGDLVVKAWAAGNSDASIATHRTPKDVRPTHLVGGDAFTGGNTVRFLWRLPAPPSASVSEFIARLSAAARSLTHVGWGIDMAAGHGGLVAEPEMAEFVSDGRLEWWIPGAIGTPLRAPQPETGQGPSTFRTLVSRHESFTLRMAGGNPQDVPPLTAFRVIGYRRTTDPLPRPFAAFSLLRTDASGFMPFDTVRRGFVVAGLMRHAASSKSVVAALGWSPEMVARFVLGHGEAIGQPHIPVQGPRLAYIPLPSIEPRGGRAEVVGSIRRAMIVVFNGQEREHVHQLARLLSGSDLNAEGSRDAMAMLSRIPDSDKMVKRYIELAKTWATVTPVILPGYDDPRKVRKRLAPKLDTDGPSLGGSGEQRERLAKLDKRIDHLLRKAIRQAGYSDVLARCAEIEWRTIGFWPGTEPATRYIFPDKLRRFRRLHVRITWRDTSGQPIQIPGPLCLGGGRFCGLGLFARID